MLIATCLRCGAPLITAGGYCHTCGYAEPLVRIGASGSVGIISKWVDEKALNDGIQAEGRMQELLKLRAENATLKAQVRELQTALEAK